MVQQRANEAHLGLSYDRRRPQPLEADSCSKAAHHVLVNGVVEKTRPVRIDTAPSPRPQLRKADKTVLQKIAHEKRA
jgi:hypothetical protein